MELSITPVEGLTNKWVFPGVKFHPTYRSYGFAHQFVGPLDRKTVVPGSCLRAKIFHEEFSGSRLTKVVQNYKRLKKTWVQKKLRLRTIHLSFQRNLDWWNIRIWPNYIYSYGWGGFGTVRSLINTQPSLQSTHVCVDVASCLGERWTTGSLGPHVRLPAQDYNFDAVFDEPLEWKVVGFLPKRPLFLKGIQTKGEPSKEKRKNR